MRNLGQGPVSLVIGKGYGSGQGSAAGIYYSMSVQSGAGGGGGHAGFGGMGSATNLSRGGNYVGSVSAPALAGSGGGGNTTFRGGAGGGAVRLTVGGRMQLDGTIAVDGARPESAFAGGGAGGSVFLEVGTLAGAGTITANGGSAYLPNGGGGSAGRIAIYFDTNVFTGNISAVGGTGFQNGAAGTIYTKANAASTGDLLVDDGGVESSNAVLTTSITPVPALTIKGRAGLQAPISFASLLLKSNSVLTFVSPLGQPNTLTISGDAVIEPGAALSLDGRGYGSGLGAGPGQYYGTYPDISSGGGGGHGGYGGMGYPGYSVTRGGVPYDYALTPNLLGSGGGGTSAYPGGSGGGSLQFNVNGTLKLDGRISADGLPSSAGGAGGGSGGGLFLNANEIRGAGVISANGGDGDLPNGGGGAGGRIAVRYANTNLFTGSITARGGKGYEAGAAGSICIYKVAGVPLLVIDNGGTQGAGSEAIVSSPVDLVVRGGAWAYALAGSISFRDLTVGSNSWLNPVWISAATIYASRNVVIENGGGIKCGGGNSNSQMAGRYNASAPSCGGGGGNGGCGGNGAVGANAAGGSDRRPARSRSLRPWEARAAVTPIRVTASKAEEGAPCG